MATKKVSIIIPNWNGKELLQKYLPKVLEAKSNSKNRIDEIIIVDDKSTDDSVKYLEKKFPEIRLIRHTENRGFSAAVNMGVRMAKNDVVCLLNTDVSPSRDFLEEVLPHFRKKNLFGISLHEKGQGVPSNIKFKNGYLDYQKGSEEKEVQQTLWISGGSGVFDRKKWLELKGLDEELLSPFYREDLDLGYRAWKRGYVLLWEPKSLVTHKHESIINANNFKLIKLNRIKERNELLFHWKNITSKNMFRKHIRGVISRALKHPGYFKIIFSTIPRLSRVIKARKSEKKEAKVSDEAIFAMFS